MSRPPDVSRKWLDGLRVFQDAHAIPVKDSFAEAPVVALHTLREAAKNAPTDYSDYLNEAVNCYEGGNYRAAIIMVWAATIQHLYGVIDGYKGGINAIEAANFARFGTSKVYHTIKKTNDLMYLSEANFLFVAEDAGLINRNARKVLTERLDLRNRCGHPTGYKPGREEAVVFIESIVNNILSGSWLSWN